MAGTTDSFGAGSEDIWVIKAGSNGVLSTNQWTYGSSESDVVAHIQETSDTGYIVAATTSSFGATNGDIWVLKLTSAGHITWQKLFGGSESNSAAHIQQTTDGGYIVAGSIGTDNGDYWILKLASDGTIEWQKSYGLQTFVPPDNYNENTEVCHHILQTTEGGYLVSGATTPSPSGNTRAWVLKLESDGDITWEKWYTILGDVSETSLLEVTGGYVMAGGSSNDAWIVKLDGSGAVLWAKRYGGSSATSTDVFSSVMQTSDSGFLVAGRMESFGVGQLDAWILKMDASGEIGDCPAMGSLSVSPEDTSASVTDTDTPVTVTAIVGAGTTVTAAATESVRRYGCVLSVPSDTRVRLPRTGQTTSYSSRDDGNLRKGVAWPVPRFTDNGDGTFTDELTGLMWLEDANCANTIGHDPDGSGTGAMDWASGFDFVEGINNGAHNISACASYTATHTDWRFANINEMESLVNAEAADPGAWLNGQGFSNAQSDRYWSSTTQAGSFPSYKWTLNLDAAPYGFLDTYTFGGHYFVWPVRAGQRDYADPRYPANVWKTGQKISYTSNDDGALEWGVSWPTPRFSDNGNGTVTDNLTGLTWLKDANCFGINTWQNSLDLVADFNLNPGSHGCSDYTATHRDWRLPNRKELYSLIDRSQWFPSGVQAGHPFVNLDSQGNSQESSTTDASDDIYLYRVLLASHGVVERVNKNVNPNLVWPVRGGPHVIALPGIYQLLLLEDPL